MPQIQPTRDYLFDQAPGLESEELATILERQATGLQATLDRIREKTQQIESDRSLSQEGKREARADAAKELRRAARSAGMHERLEAIREEVESERERLEAQRLKIEGEDPDPAAEREVRDRLRRIRDRENGDLDVRAIVLEAAREDRRLLLRAVERDPLADVDPLTGPDTLREVRETHLRTRFPDRAQRLEEMGRVSSLMATNLDRADEVAVELTGAPLRESEDPVLEAV